MSMGSKKTILKRTTAYVLAFVMAFSLLFTGNNAVTASAASAVTKITVKKKSVTIEPKKTVNVGVTVKGGNKKFTAKSSNKKIATVKVVGKKVRITAKKKTGSAKITVTTKGKNTKGKKLKATIKVKVENQPATTEQATTQQPTTQQPVGPKPEDKYNNVKITTPTTTDGSSPSVNVGTSTKLTANVDAADAGKVVWKSSNPSVAIVSEDGTVTGVSAGTVEAIATMNGKEIGKISITISSVAVSGVTLDRNTLTLTENNTATLTATVAPANATVRTVTWSSSNDSVATVSSTGVVRAIKAGTATITVTTTDKSFTATCTVNVTADSKDNVNGLKLKVTNAIEGYDNTVLVGTNARISATVLKDGAPVREEIKVELIPATGYTDYYVTSLDGSEGFVKTDAEDGTATFTVALNSENSDKKPIISSLYARDERAYASFRVKVTASGSSYEEEIPLSFAQVLAETDQAPVAIAVDNLHDPDLKPLEGTDSPITDHGTIGYTTDKKRGYPQEYVVDQQVSTNEKDHTVYFDAAPMLLLPAVAGKEEGSDYSKTINYEVKEYSVYRNEDNAHTLSNVPAGLQYLTLHFDSLKLSEYTRIVVRAYKADTNIPLLDNNGKLIQDTIDDTVKLTSGAGGNTVQVAQEIFKKTAGEKTIDLKIFVESAGQVNENNNVGFKITKVVGKFENQELQPYVLERISSAVTWSIDNTDYTASQTLDADKAQDLLGSAYSSNNTYTVSLPTFPSSGDAIITEWEGKATEKIVNCYVYPTAANLNFNTDTNKNELISNNAYYTFMGTVDSPNELSVAKTTDEYNRLKVDSKKVGHVQVKASVNFGPAGDKGVHYDAYSSVQFSPIPKNLVEVPTDFYALAGQKITVKLEVRDENGNVVSDFEPEWKGLGQASQLGINIDRQDSKTASDGTAYLELTAAKGSVIKDISVKSDTYNIKMTVAGNVVNNNHVSLNWVRAGVYYKNSVTGDEYDTSVKASTATVKAVTSNYKVTDTWIVGTQVCGVVGVDNNKNENIDSNEVVKEVSEIKNVLIDMAASSSDADLNTQLDKDANGVCKWTNEKTGNATLTAEVAGLEANKQPVFVFEDGTTATGVGTGDVTKFAKLEVPVVWEVSGSNFSLINNNPVFDYSNADKPRVYFQILDDKGNKVPNTEVVYSVSDGTNSIVAETTVDVADGLRYIEIAKPNKAITYTISAYVKNSGKDAAKTTTIQFKDASDSFVLNNSPIAEDLNAKTITFTFSQKVNPELVNLVTKDFFTVTKQDGITKVTVTDVKVDSSNKQKVTLTLSDIETGMHLAINPTITVDGIQYLLIDENGTYFTK